jgi:hypothetical protein
MYSIRIKNLKETINKKERIKQEIITDVKQQIRDEAMRQMLIEILKDQEG